MANDKLDWDNVDWDRVAMSAVIGEFALTTMSMAEGYAPLEAGILALPFSILYGLARMGVQLKPEYALQIGGLPDNKIGQTVTAVVGAGLLAMPIHFTMKEYMPAPKGRANIEQKTDRPLLSTMNATSTEIAAMLPNAVPFSSGIKPIVA